MINKKAIMRRVYIIWFGRQILSPRTFKAGLLTLFMWQFTAQVHIASVFANAPFGEAGLSTNFHFFELALLNTDFLTLAVLAGVALSGLFFLRELLPRRATAHLGFVRI